MEKVTHNFDKFRKKYTDTSLEISTILCKKGNDVTFDKNVNSNNHRKRFNKRIHKKDTNM